MHLRAAITPTFLALVMGVRIASTITTSSGLSRAPAKAPDEAERCEPIISIRRAASMVAPGSGRGVIKPDVPALAPRQRGRGGVEEA